MHDSQISSHQYTHDIPDRLEGDLIAYFGYGSLVNRDTHRTEIVAACPAKLSGWRRIWQPQLEGQFTDRPLLTVFPHQETAIEGLLVIDHARNLANVDEREVNYQRVEISHNDLELLLEEDRRQLVQALPTYLYVADPVEPSAASRQEMIIQSYLDAVLQGYYREFGTAGVGRFMTSTDNFTPQIRDDRANPDYPRAVDLNPDEIALVNSAIGHLRG